MGDEDDIDQVKMEDDGVVALGGGWWVKSRRKAKASSLAEVGHASTSGGLVVSSSKPSVRFGGLGLKIIGGQFHWFGPQNPGGGSDEEWTAHGGIEEFASRRSYLMARWPSDEDYLGLDHNALGLYGLTQISKGKMGIV